MKNIFLHRQLIVLVTSCNIIICFAEYSEDTKGVIKSHNFEERQHNGKQQDRKDKQLVPKRYTCLTQKTEVEIRSSGRVSISCTIADTLRISVKQW